MGKWSNHLKISYIIEQENKWKKTKETNPCWYNFSGDIIDKLKTTEILNSINLIPTNFGLYFLKRCFNYLWLNK